MAALRSTCRSGVVPDSHPGRADRYRCGRSAFCLRHGTAYARRAGEHPARSGCWSGRRIGIGSAAIQIARELGCTVIATAGSEDKLAKARELGAAHVINHAETPRFELEVMKITDGRGVDVVFEHIGPATWRHSLASLRTGGRVVTCGGLTGRMAETDLWNLFWRQFTILGSMGATRADMAGVLELIEAGRWRRSSIALSRCPRPGRPGAPRRPPRVRESGRRQL